MKGLEVINLIKGFVIFYAADWQLVFYRGKARLPVMSKIT